MICLTFEFTSSRRSVAVADGRRVLAEATHEGDRRTPVFALVTRALDEAGVDRARVRRLAVSIGPGSYTGIRIAISAAQGWAMATGAETVAVDTFEALRLGAVASGRDMPCAYAVDAQRNDFAVREWDGAAWTGPMRLEPCDGVLRRISGGRPVLGPELGVWFRSLAKTGTPVAWERLAASAELFPSAADVARLAVQAPAVDPGSLAPVYLREAAFAKAPPARAVPGISDPD